MERKTCASLVVSAVLGGIAGGMVSGMLLTANNVMAQKTASGNPAVNDELRARKILLVDEKGMTRAKLGLWPNGRPAWFAYDEKGIPGASLNLKTDAAGIALIDGQGKVVWSAP
jgi:hypothetical protein